MWPTSIQLPSGFTETIKDPAIRTEMENGIVLTRPRYTRMRRTWELTWANMVHASFTTLQTFYQSVCGGAQSFQWTHPIDAGTYTVRFVGDLEFKKATGQRGCWSVTVKLEEV